MRYLFCFAKAIEFSSVALQQYSPSRIIAVKQTLLSLVLLRRRIKSLIIFPLVLFCSGCVVSSISPLFTAKDLISDPALVGSWLSIEQGNPEEIANIKEESTNHYALALKDASQEDLFDLYVVQLGQARFLDLFPKEKQPGEFSKMERAPLHFFYRYEIVENKLRLFMIDPDWLETKVEEEKINLNYSRIGKKSDWFGQEMILTSSTEELRQFVINYALQDPKAFKETSDEPLVKKE